MAEEIVIARRRDEDGGEGAAWYSTLARWVGPDEETAPASDLTSEEAGQLCDRLPYDARDSHPEGAGEALAALIAERVGEVEALAIMRVVVERGGFQGLARAAG